jgi:hypothetical protein
MAAALQSRTHAAAAEDGTTSGTGLETVTVIATGVSRMNAASAGDVSQEELASRALLRPGAILESVPGLIVTQHSGEGKANQYFLRAFNLDHGTDLATEVDDVPVNLPTHAHGQGYSDLNFLIPELVSDLHFKKGPYYADEGDFATAGAVRLALADTGADAAMLELGARGYRRALVTASTQTGPGDLLFAADLYHDDGPFDRPDDYDRRNVVLRYHAGDAGDYLALTAMGYAGAWNATDQVPEHAVSRGDIDRFGSLAPSDGGASRRASLSLELGRAGDGAPLQLSVYVIRYRLDLWSTFTYYLHDPVNGDQMLQHDDRVVYGFKGSRTFTASLGGMPSTTVVGVQARVDDIRDVAIDATAARRYLYTRQDAGVLEANGALFVENSTQWSPVVRAILGARADSLYFAVHDKMLSSDASCSLASDPLGCDTGHKRAGIFTPKLGLIFGPFRRTSYFVSVAGGYHSNDARGITRDGENPDAQPVRPLTRALSAELGVHSEPLAGWHTSLDAFLLKLQSELVFEGDAGVTAPSGATTRSGIEWSNTWRIADWLRADVNAAFSRARFDRDVMPDDLGCAEATPAHPCAQSIAIVGRYVPNSPTNVIDAGVTAERPSGWFGSLRARHFGRSPLVEDDSARSPAYTTVDLQLGFQQPGRWQCALEVFNLFNTRWNDIEYYYVSRLQNERSAAPDYVVHPGTPRTARLRFQYFY